MINFVSDSTTGMFWECMRCSVQGIIYESMLPVAMSTCASAVCCSLTWSDQLGEQK